MNVAIIGGGASGIVCAVELKRKNKNIAVTVYEKLPRILKKLLVTGNGRCNLTNSDSSMHYYRGDGKLAVVALSRFPYESTEEFFRSMGLVTRIESQGRVYPASGTASSVVNALLAEAQELGVEILTETPIKTIEAKDGGYLLNGKYRADFVVISCGASAAKAQGTDGDSFRLFDALGVRYTAPRPALTGVIIDGFPKSLKGIRSRCEVALFADGGELYREEGEIQFNDYGVSGIPIMQLSGLIDTTSGKNYSLVFDFLPDFKCGFISKLFAAQQKEHPLKSAELLVGGLMPKQLGNYLLLEAGIRKDTALKDISSDALKKLTDVISHKRFSSLSLRDFEYAQVTCGGIGSDEINPGTLELKKHKGIYVTGEALNVDGLCGGHNLQFAWSTGRLAAESIGRKIDKN